MRLILYVITGLDASPSFVNIGKLDVYAVYLLDIV